MTPAAQERLREIYDRNNGLLRPEDVVEDAKDESSPLHGEFVWDVSKAAYAHWLNTARRLIRSVKVVFETEETVISHAKYIRDPRQEPDKQGYVETVSLRDEESVAREAAQRELRRALQLLQRACDIAAVLGLDEEFSDVLKRSESLLLKVAA